MGFIAWIILGFVGGAIGKAVVGKSMGWIATLVCGLIGGVVGGWIVGMLTGGDKGIDNFFSPWSWLAAIVGSIVVVWVVSLFAGRSSKAYPRPRARLARPSFHSSCPGTTILRHK